MNGNNNKQQEPDKSVPYKELRFFWLNKIAKARN